MSIIVGISATAISLAVGSLLGMSACYAGGFYEKVVMRLFDTLLAFPSLILAMVIADYLGAVEDPAELAARLAATPGVVEHGLFPPALVSEVIVGRGSSVELL